MTIPLVLSGLGLLLGPLSLRSWGRRLPPAEWARACAGLLAVGAVLVELGLVVHAAPTVLRTVGLDRVADLCEHALGPVAPGGLPAGAVAAFGAVLLLILAARALVGARRVPRAAWIEPEVA